MGKNPSEEKRRARVRMTGKERREQLLDIGRHLFAERGFDGASIEEVASRAGVSKPVVYEHFGGKEGLFAVVVDREMRNLLERDFTALEPETNDNVPQAHLTPAELRCLSLMAEGYPISRIARALEVEPGEVQVMEKNIIAKFNSNNRFQAVAKAVMLGIVGH